MSASWLLLQQALQEPREQIEGAIDDVADAPFDRMVVAVDWRNINLDDLMRCRPGGVIRCNGNPHEVILPLRVFTGRPAVEGDI